MPPESTAGHANIDIPNVVSVDVEDWYQSCINNSAPISDRCYESTSRCLDLFDDAGVKGTFFVQSMVAQQKPEVVREIMKRGHDIQTHGHSHQHVNVLGPDGFKKDLLRSKQLIEDITGRPVTGFRAPDFTIFKDGFWAFDVMAELGLTFDSSIFPMRTRRYGITGFERGYSKVISRSGAVIEELPVSIVKTSLMSIPVGGGGYFRLWPKSFLKAAYDNVNSEGRPFVIYCHPYEFNTKEWESMPSGVSPLYRLHQSIGRGGFIDKIKFLLSLGRYGTMPEALEFCRTRE